MSPIHLVPPKRHPQSAMATVRQYAQLNFLNGVSADWIMPFLAILCLGYLVYFVAN